MLIFYVLINKKIICNTSTKRQDRFCTLQNMPALIRRGLDFSPRAQSLGLLATLDASGRACSASVFHSTKSSCLSRNSLNFLRHRREVMTPCRRALSNKRTTRHDQATLACLYHYDHGTSCAGRGSLYRSLRPGRNPQGACPCHSQTGIESASMGIEYPRNRLHAQDLQGRRSSCAPGRGRRRVLRCGHNADK